MFKPFGWLFGAKPTTCSGNVLCGIFLWFDQDNTLTAIGENTIDPTAAYGIEVMASVEVIELMQSGMTVEDMADKVLARGGQILQVLTQHEARRHVIQSRLNEMFYPDGYDGQFSDGIFILV